MQFAPTEDQALSLHGTRHTKKWWCEMGTLNEKSGKDARPDGEVATRSAAYADGEAFDLIHYLEAKLILKPDRFTSVDSLRFFGNLVRRAAKAVGVGYIADGRRSQRPNIREIVFGDTHDVRLYQNAFILRRRTTYVDGFPVGDPEIAFKFRHPDGKRAAAVDVRPKIDGEYRIKFAAELCSPTFWVSRASSRHSGRRGTREIASGQGMRCRPT